MTTRLLCAVALLHIAAVNPLRALAAGEPYEHVPAQGGTPMLGVQHDAGAMGQSATGLRAQADAIANTHIRHGSPRTRLGASGGDFDRLRRIDRVVDQQILHAIRRANRHDVDRDEVQPALTSRIATERPRRDRCKRCADARPAGRMRRKNLQLPVHVEPDEQLLARLPVEVDRVQDVGPRQPEWSEVHQRGGVEGLRLCFDDGGNHDQHRDDHKTVHHSHTVASARGVFYPNLQAKRLAKVSR